MGKGLEMFAERKGLLVETGTKLGKGRAIANLEHHMYPLDECLHVAVVGCAVVVQNRMVLGYKMFFLTKISVN